MTPPPTRHPRRGTYRRTHNLLFRLTERILRRDLPQFLKDVISNRSPASIPSKVVLVGHNISTELDMMEKLGINLWDTELFSIEGILDISNKGLVEALGLPFSRRPSLVNILEHFGIPFQKYYLHVAGNDAHFTLRALLMIAAIRFERMGLEDPLNARISDSKSIVLDPIDFVSPAPDTQRSRLIYNAKKAAGCALKREPKKM